MNRASHLLCLDPAALSNVFKCMEPPELMVLSFVSSRCKQLVIDSYLKSDNFAVLPTESINLFFGCNRKWAVTFSFHPDTLGNLRTDFNSHVFVVMLNSTNHIDDNNYERLNYSIGRYGIDRMTHLMSVGKVREVSHLTIHGSSARYRMIDIHNIIKNFPVKELCLRSCCTRDLTREVFDTFTFSAELTIERNVHQNMDDYRSAFLENRHLLKIFNESLLSFNDLLATNSRIIRFRSNFTDKEINRFLTLWQKGSCPNLEALVLLADRQELNMNLILKGLGAIIAPADRRQTFQSAQDPLYREEIKGGYDIWTVSRQRATLTNYIWNNFGYINLYVFEKF